MRADVWITGIGMVTPLGIGWRENWDAMCDGRSGVRAVRSFDPAGLPSRIAGEVPERFDIEYRQKTRLPFPTHYGRFSQLALMAAQQAWQDAELDLEREDRERVGASIGVGAGAFHYLTIVNDALIEGRRPLYEALDHTFVIKSMHNAATAQLCIWQGLRGPSTTTSVACASGAQSIATAMDWLTHGRADVAFAGAADATVNPFVLHAYCQIGALSTCNDEPARASRPFDRRRDGFVMAEGACVLVLESAEHARARGARCYARLLGYAYHNEGYNIVMPRPGGEGIAQTLRLALRDAELRPEQIDYISAHGTSTRLNDVNETKGIKTIFGDYAYRLPVSAQKSMIGHAIGATSAIQTAITALIIRHGILTPTINLEEPDPECDLDYVSDGAREAEVDYAIANAFGFGGHNCCLVLGR